MLKEIFYNSLKIFEIYKDLYGKRPKGLAGKSCFSHTNPSNFRRPRQSLLFRYCMRLKINRLRNFNAALSVRADEIFQKRTVVVLTES